MYSRNPYNYDKDEASRETGLVTTLPSLAQQQYKEECDINTIARNFGLTGKLPTPVYLPTFGDFSNVTDFQTALHAIQTADASFLAMPSHVRERFQNNPQRFLEFTSDPRNAEEARSLGLMRDAPSPPPPQPAIVNPTPVAETI